jgi:hypothetical protein
MVENIKIMLHYSSRVLYVHMITNELFCALYVLNMLNHMLYHCDK